MNFIKYILTILLLSPAVSAGVVISQVLYDPVGTESGGEAVELKNDGASVEDISGWVIATESSLTDATLPSDAVLQPGETFLVTDKGWDENKDDSTWRSADYEETITLGNKNSGVALISNGEFVDAVGWGEAGEIDNGLYEGVPAAAVGVGKSLLRTQDSDDNVEDFVEADADFQPGIAVPVTADIVITAPVIEISSSLDIVPEGILSIKNNGEIPINVELVFNDLKYGNHTIPKSAISIDTPLEFVVNAGEEHESRVSLNIPTGTVPGKYTSTLRVIYGS